MWDLVGNHIVGFPMRWLKFCQSFENIFISTTLEWGIANVTFYSPALEKWGYTGFTLSFRGSVIPSFRHSVVPSFREHFCILFPLNI